MHTAHHLVSPPAFLSRIPFLAPHPLRLKPTTAKLSPLADLWAQRSKAAPTRLESARARMDATAVPELASDDLAFFRGAWYAFLIAGAFWATVACGIAKAVR